MAKADRPGMAYAMELTAATEAVKAAAAAADVVIVYMHWGQEYNECPTGAMKTFAQQISAAGADLIIGTHAHKLRRRRLAGLDLRAVRPVELPLVAQRRGQQRHRRAARGLLGPSVKETTFLPAYIDRKTGQPIPSPATEKNRIANKYAGLRGCTGLADAPTPA